MILEQNQNLATINFHRGYDVTADMLNAQGQYVNEEVIGRTKDMMQYPGFGFGLAVGAISGQSVTVTQGTAFDQQGSRLSHPSDVSYKVSFPTLNSGVNTGFLCVRAKSVNVSYRNHPYTGVRLPVESSLGLEFYIDLTSFTDSLGNVYPSNNNGLIISKLTIVGATYSSDNTVRSPFVSMKIS